MRATAPGLCLEVDRFDYAGRPLFEGLRLEVEGGRFTCILGPSGCGKTTILRMLAELVPQVRVRATDGGQVGGRIAYMAQTDLLLPWLPVLENVVLGWRLRRAPRASLAEARHRALDLLRELGLEAYAAALPQSLSGGMRQRAALARTLIEARPIVLMDEPFSALDAITRHRLQDRAARLLAERTVVLVTHDPREALRLGHRLLILEGRPARLRPPILLAGAIPRDATDPGLLAHEGRLLDELAASAAGFEPA